MNTLRVLCTFAILISLSTNAFALKQFYDEFVEMYAGDDSAASEEFKELVADKKNKCLICHQGKKKKNRNAYGEALAEHITKKDKKEVDKIIAALETVAEQSSEADNDEAPTFGQLIAEGSLPGGAYEDCKEEPAVSEED